jgi:ElaA protein
MLQLRSEVFVLEQACAFQDLDGADTEAMHLLGERTGASPPMRAALPPA